MAVPFCQQFKYTLQLFYPFLCSSFHVVCSNDYFLLFVFHRIITIGRDLGDHLIQPLCQGRAPSLVSPVLIYHTNFCFPSRLLVPYFYSCIYNELQMITLVQSMLLVSNQQWKNPDGPSFGSLGNFKPMSVLTALLQGQFPGKN